MAVEKKTSTQSAWKVNSCVLKTSGVLMCFVFFLFFFFSLYRVDAWEEKRDDL